MVENPAPEEPALKAPVEPQKTTEGGTPTPGKTTPDYLLYFKEFVTAFLGIVIIFAALYLMWPSLSSNDPTKLPMANGIFAILGGWGGVVLGYYFGRIPAEKATDNANQAADKAKNEAALANANKAKAIMEAHNQLVNADNVLTRVKEKVPVAKTLAPEAQSILNEIENQKKQIKEAQEKIKALL